MDMEHKNIQLLDLSDELLLNIFRHCSPRDLKALSFTCERLGMLVLDRTLWRCVDTRDQQTGRTRLKWYLTHALHNDTRELHMTGYAREAKGCCGYVIRPQPSKDGGMGPGAYSLTGGVPWVMTRRMRRARCYRKPRRSTSMLMWQENEMEKFDDVSAPVGSVQDSTCPGPQFTLSAALMVQLQIVCPALTSMSVEYCNINCYNGAISQFPPTLRHLSLRGVRCYNMKTRFLNRISSYLPYLESLDGSECEFINCLDWSTLSELRNLRRLILQNCTNLDGTLCLGRNKTNFGTLEEPDYLKKYSFSINLDDIERNTEDQDLDTASHVFLRQDHILKTLEPPYTGPYKVLSRGENAFIIVVRGKNMIVSIDRLKPAFTASEDPVTKPSTNIEE